MNASPRSRVLARLRLQLSSIDVDICAATESAEENQSYQIHKPIRCDLESARIGRVCASRPLAMHVIGTLWLVLKSR
jgi:hypothetical protein